MNHVFYFSVCAAFLANAWFLAAGLAARARSAGWRKSLAWSALLVVAFAAGQLFYGGAEPRGGYDNDHDFQYLSLSFFRPGAASMIMTVKEASPLVFDGLSDAATGYSLRAAPAKNRLLMFLAAAILSACLLDLGFGLSAACFGFALFYLNFLSALNANTFATTAGNMFLLFSALLAAARLRAGDRALKSLAWALAAFFLVWTGRCELAFLPGLLLCAALLSPDGILRAAAQPRRHKVRAWLLLGLAAALCAAWAALVLARLQYNGPPAGEAARLLAHFRYQFGENNLGVFLPSAAGAAPYLAAAAFLLTFFKALFSARRGPALALWTILLLWAACFCSIFMLQDGYPLQFMRHRLYFFVPFVFLFAAAWDACWEQFRGRAAAALKWGALACFCALYLGANLKAARALEPEKRTNDLEWALLLKASRNWPEGCALMYPGSDRHHRQALLDKYFPLLSGGCGRKTPPCVINYLPPIYRIFVEPAQPARRGYTPASPVYAGPGARPLFEAAFPHKFYTAWDSEVREEIPLRFGFYYADSPEDRARLREREKPCADPAAARSSAESRSSKVLADEAVALIRAGNHDAAEVLLARAVKTDPSNAEAFLSLCFVQFSKKDRLRALENCDWAGRAAGAYPPGAGKILASEAAYLKAQVLAAMGRGTEAAEELKKALSDPPPGWSGLKAARAELGKLEKKKAAP